MTFLEKIKPHLLSEDFLIQEFVLHSIHDYPNLPVEWTNQLLEEAFRNEDKLSSILIYVDNQLLNDESIKILTENIPTMKKSKVHLALHLLGKAEPEATMRNKELLQGLIPDDLWDFYKLLIAGTEEEVYSEYGAILNRLDANFENYVYVKAKKLAAAIVKRGWVPEYEIDIVMEEELNKEWFSFNGILTVYMIGLLQMEKYIPVLASLLDSDDDILLEEVSAALISFQSNEVVEAVKPYLSNSDSVIYASSIVENIKSEEAVEALREAYRNVKEETDQDILFEALCHQLSLEALPEINTHMEKDNFSGMVEIEPVIYGYYSLMGIDHPNMEVWRKVGMEQEMNYRKIKAQSMVQPGVKVTKVGRNEPCPCGSGKKYKKCCGK